ncbi:hypothetical protein MP228_009920 [Amoeboaphelidium protococcarum]|nr:hypothetical protein MP228_009920 [Amoeboaphelidium protococcarum]
MEELQTLKQELKQWENNFKKTNGRDPSKKDIDLQPDIVKKYKSYSKLKNKTKSDSTKLPQQKILQKDDQVQSTQVVKDNKSKLENKLKKLKSVHDEEIAATPGVKQSSGLLELFQSPCRSKNKSSSKLISKLYTVQEKAVDDACEQIKIEREEQQFEEEEYVSVKVVQSRQSRPQPVKSSVKKRLFQSVDAKPTTQEYNIFQSPAARKGIMRNSQSTEAVERRLNLELILQSPHQRLKQTTAKEEADDEENGDQVDEQTAQLKPPTFDDDQPLNDYQDQENDQKYVKKNKKPILGKRQTSKRKLEPVYKSTEVAGAGKQQGSSKTGRAPQARRLKTNRRGNKSISIDYSKVDKIAVKTEYKR